MHVRAGYVGEVKTGFRHGKGVLQVIATKKEELLFEYSGDWEAGMCAGQGTVTVNGTIRYEEGWGGKDGLPDGYGVWH